MLAQRRKAAIKFWIFSTHCSYVDSSTSQTDFGDNDDDESMDATCSDLSASEPQTPTSPKVYETVDEFIEYGNDILQSLKSAEQKFRGKSTYMSRQRDINHVMRTTLINWLIEVGHEYDVQSETIHLTVSYIDRFLSVMSVARSKLQLIGITALYIAAKYEETSPLAVNDLVLLADGAYTVQQVLKMEQMMLRILKFDLCVPTAYAFLSAYCVASNTNEETKFLAQYIAELAMLHGEQFLKYLPSEMAAAALALARFIMHEPIWSKKLEVFSGYAVQQLRDHILVLAAAHAESGTLSIRTVHTKYMHRSYLSVAKHPAADIDDDMLSKAIHLSNVMKEVDSSGKKIANATRTENIRKIMSKLLFD